MRTPYTITRSTHGYRGHLNGAVVCEGRPLRAVMDVLTYEEARMQQQTQTCAIIGLVQASGTVRAITTHWDGEPSHHGPILLHHYATLDAVTALLDLGDLSVLAPELGARHDPWLPIEAQLTWCITYARDFGCRSSYDRVYKDVAAFLRAARWHSYIYAYLFDGRWWVYVNGDVGSRRALADGVTLGDTPAVEDSVVG